LHCASFPVSVPRVANWRHGAAPLEQPAGNELHPRSEREMNKSELIDAIASGAEMSKAGAGRALDAALGAITGALTSGDTVSLVGFGTFSVKERAARIGRNPRTGKSIQIAASKNVGFKAGKSLKDSVNV